MSFVLLIKRVKPMSLVSNHDMSKTVPMTFISPLQNQSPLFLHSSALPDTVFSCPFLLKNVQIELTCFFQLSFLLTPHNLTKVSRAFPCELCIKIPYINSLVCLYILIQFDNFGLNIISVFPSFSCPNGLYSLTCAQESRHTYSYPWHFLLCFIFFTYVWP